MISNFLLLNSDQTEVIVLGVFSIWHAGNYSLYSKEWVVFTLNCLVQVFRVHAGTRFSGSGYSCHTVNPLCWLSLSCYYTQFLLNRAVSECYRYPPGSLHNRCDSVISLYMVLTR